jgi:hypothetical protein
VSANLDCAWEPHARQTNIHEWKYQRLMFQFIRHTREPRSIEIAVNYVK